VEHKYNAFWNCDLYKVIECQTCGFKHIYPIPSQKELDNFYKEKYFREVKPVAYENIHDEAILKAKASICKNENFQSIYEKVIELKQSDFMGILDIGCGNNLLSYLFKSKGWREYIIEPSKDAGSYLKRFELNVMNEPIEEVDIASFQDISFINLQFVLEHLTSPLEILQQAYQLLSPGGIIRICVPNDFSEGQLAYMDHFEEKARWVCLPDHINYFDFNSLNKVLTKIGFNEVYRTTDFPLELLLMSGMNYYASEQERKKVHPFIANFEGALISTGRKETLQTFYETLAKADFGRNIYMYAIKPI
jgi:SAM-dependent methyltransferase